MKKRTKIALKKRRGIPHTFKAGKTLVALRKTDFRTMPLSVDRAGTWRKILQFRGR